MNKLELLKMIFVKREHQLITSNNSMSIIYLPFLIYLSIYLSASMSLKLLKYKI